MTATGGTVPPAIDVHAHFVDAEALAEMGRAVPDSAPVLRRSGADWSISLPPGLTRTFPQGVTRPVPAGLVDLDVRLAAMKEQGVGIHALSGYTWLNFYALPAGLAATLHRIGNDGMIRTAREHPEHFLAMPTLPMQDPALAVAEIERVAELPEVVGVGIGTNIDGVNLDDERFEPVWEALDHHGLPVLVHPPGLIAGADRMRSYHLINLIGNPVDTTIAIGSVVCSGMLERYPNLRFCFVHGGGFAPYQAGRWDHGFEVRTETRSRIDRPPSEYVGRCWFDTLTHDPRSLRFLGERFGWSQVLLGTDYPWDMSTEHPLADLDAAGVTGPERDLVTSLNAAAFLRASLPAPSTPRPDAP
jgi:aminocarboxymuconate-semialdehyde decarboxylase